MVFAGTLSQRLGLVAIASSPQVHAPDPRHEAGDRAEQEVLCSVRSAAAERESQRGGAFARWAARLLARPDDSVHAFRNVRCPDCEGSGRRELDIVLVSRHRVLVIEVKNWSGALELELGGESNRGCGADIECGAEPGLWLQRQQ